MMTRGSRPGWPVGRRARRVAAIRLHDAAANRLAAADAADPAWLAALPAGQDRVDAGQDPVPRLLPGNPGHEQLVVAGVLVPDRGGNGKPGSRWLPGAPRGRPAYPPAPP